MPKLGGSPGEGNGNPFQYSCLENPMDRGPGRLQSMGSQSWTRLRDFTFSLSFSFMDLTFQVPMQYCSLQHWTSITCHIHNWSLFLFWLCLFILSGVILPFSPVAYWAPTDLESSSFSVIPFGLFILFMVFSRQEYENNEIK